MDASVRTIVFAHARSGSTSLVRSLNLHPDLDFAEEPFHSKYGQWNPEERSYIETIADVPTLNAALAEIFAKHNGMKILDYQLPEAVYDDLLLRDEYKVICLRRRNALQTVVSNMIASQTNVWHIADRKPQRGAEQALQPLALDDIQRRLEYHDELQTYYRPVIARKPGPLRLFVDYEDLYTASMEQNRAQLAAIFEFIGVCMHESPQINEFLDPRSAKIVTKENYEQIPNLREIEARFGSDERGWLIRRA